MKTPNPSPRLRRSRVKPGRDHWWWRPAALRRALARNPRLDHFFYWKLKGRKGPHGEKWTREQRKLLETSLWLYELDARISRRYLFDQPVYLLPPKNLDSVVAFAAPTNAVRPPLGATKRHRPFAWQWIEFFDKRDEKKTAKLTRAELNGIIAAMKYCVEYFLHG